MKLINWMFGRIKESLVMQGLLGGVLVAHILVLGFWGIAWLYHFLPWPK